MFLWSRHVRTLRFLRTVPALALCFLAAALSACRTDYTEDAVERAREFALENLRGVSAEQMEFIRFTQPEIYENVIFPRQVMPLQQIGHIKSERYESFPEAPHLDLMHSCVVWDPPGLGAKVVVVGASERSMLFWKPSRVLVKQYLPSDSAYTAAMNACVRYAQNNMLYLTVPETNRIRFSEPAEIRFTKIDMEPPEKQRENSLESEWAAYLRELEAEPEELHQLSLIWNGDHADQRIVFSGYTATGTLRGWKLKTAEKMSLAKLHANLLSDEDAAKIKIAPEPAVQQVHPKEERIDRRGDTAAPDSPKTGGSIVYH